MATACSSADSRLMAAQRAQFELGRTARGISGIWDWDQFNPFSLAKLTFSEV